MTSSRQQPKDEFGSLERARQRVFEPEQPLSMHENFSPASLPIVPHEWEKNPLNRVPAKAPRHVRIAGLFFAGSAFFFLVALSVAAYVLYSGGNSVSVNNITVDIQGPTTIAAGDTVPFSLIITNKNPVAVQNATIEMNFPPGTRSADNVMKDYQRYTENIGTIPAGGIVTRTVKAIIFGGAGDTLLIPVSLSYGITSSNATFTKKSTYGLTISSSPLSISVDTLAQIVSGKPLTIVLNVRSNATVPLDNVIINASLPFGFSVSSSSVPLTGSSFYLGTFAPGASDAVTLIGVLSGQDGEQRVFSFSVGTAQNVSDTTNIITYMTQNTTIAIAAPFLQTTLSIGGASADNIVVAPGTAQSATLSYTNTLATNITNATISLQISGSAVDYNSIRSTTGFYDSNTHTILFSSDTDPALASLAPGASGIGSFTFSTLNANAFTTSPQIILTISVAGTRIGQTNIPEQVTASVTDIVKVETSVTFSVHSLHSSGSLTNSGPIPPRVGHATTYTIQLGLQNPGNAVAGGIVSMTLPSYVTYVGQTSGIGTFAYDDPSRTVTWTAGDIGQDASAQGLFQVSLTPSFSQIGSAPQLTGVLTFSGYDRFAGVSISVNADPVTTEITSDPGYITTDATVVQ